MPSQPKSPSLQAALDQITKQFGAGSIMLMSDQPNAEVKTVSTGILPLDIALGVGGYPTGRIVEIYGPESSGKSTLALHAVAEQQKVGGVCAYVDAEHALDPLYASALGVNVEALYLSQPSTGEEALEIVDALTKSAAISLIVIDSVAALTPRAEIEGEMGASNIGLQARLMSQALRKITGSAYKNGVSIIFINQLREKVGVMFGSPETTTGGKALKYYASVRLDVRRTETLKTDGEASGNRTRVKVVKNKVAPPHKQTEFDIVYGEGVPHVGCLVDVAVGSGVIKKSGSWFSYNEIRLGQGRNGAIQFLSDNQPVAAEIETIVRGVPISDTAAIVGILAEDSESDQE